MKNESMRLHMGETERNESMRLHSNETEGKMTPMAELVPHLLQPCRFCGQGSQSNEAA